MFRFKALLEENMERLARIISEEHGKVFSDAVGELTRGLEVVEFACGIPHLQRRTLCERWHRCRQPLTDAAARGLRRDHAV